MKNSAFPPFLNTYSTKIIGFNLA